MNELNQEYHNYILSVEWNKKRKLAFKLFGKKCQRCLNTKQLHVHHKTYVNFKNENIETDLAILCKKCHEQYHHKFAKATIATTNMFISHGLFEDKPKQKVRNKKSKYTESSLKKQQKVKKGKVKRVKMHSDFYREVKFQKHQELRELLDANKERGGVYLSIEL